MAKQKNNKKALANIFMLKEAQASCALDGETQTFDETIEELYSKYICNKCKDKGIIFEGKGKMVHTCFDCLRAGRLG